MSVEAAPAIDFRCKVCGVDCDVAPSDGSGAICPAHCEDHDYEYERGEGHRCKHCNAEPPDDWFYDGADDWR
jgi:hypothetical protein